MFSQNAVEFLYFSMILTASSGQLLLHAAITYRLRLETGEWGDGWRGGGGAAILCLSQTVTFWKIQPDIYRYRYRYIHIDIWISKGIRTFSPIASSPQDGSSQILLIRTVRPT